MSTKNFHHKYLTSPPAVLSTPYMTGEPGFQILPFNEQTATYDNIISNHVIGCAWPPDPTVDFKLAAYLCPSDGNGKEVRYAPTNYAFCFGDGMWHHGEAITSNNAKQISSRLLFIRNILIIL